MKRTLILLPWFVCVSPEYYDDDDDTGFNWEGMAYSHDDAVRRALIDCHLQNKRAIRWGDEFEGNIDPDGSDITVHVAEPDFRTLCRRFIGRGIEAARRIDKETILTALDVVDRRLNLPEPDGPVDIYSLAMLGGYEAWTDGCIKDETWSFQMPNGELFDQDCATQAECWRAACGHWLANPTGGKVPLPEDAAAIVEAYDAALKLAADAERFAEQIGA